jgi:hypothetical protein
MEQSKAMEYESRKASSDVLKPRYIYIYPAVFVRPTNQSVKHKHIYLYLSMTRLHVSVYTDHHQATIAKLSKQGRIQHNYIHNMGVPYV